MTEKEIVAAAKSDPDAQPTDREFWKDAKVVLPERKQPADRSGCTELVQGSGTALPIADECGPEGLRTSPPKSGISVAGARVHRGGTARLRVGPRRNELGSLRRPRTGDSRSD